MKELKIITVVPGDLNFAWEIEILISSLRRYTYSDKLQVLVKKTKDWKTKDQYIWNRLSNRYPEVEFYYFDTPEVDNLIPIYQPIIRPNILKQHFKLHPELAKEAILYIDSDIIFTKCIDFSKYLNDDINYCSRTPYIDANYFYSKTKDVLNFRLPEYRTHNILKELCSLVGIPEQVVVDNIENTGGCQWILKDTNWQFWEKLETSCIKLSLHCKDINSRFFSPEDKGLQAWAIADMCGILWNLWKEHKETQCPEELNFCWATTPIKDFDKYSILHNAGVSGNYQIIDGKKQHLFNKCDTRFRTGLITPFNISPKGYRDICTDYCGYEYVKFLLSIKDPITKIDLNNIVY